MISALYFSPIARKNFDRFVARHFLAVHRQILLHDLGHLLLDRARSSGVKGRL